jgi:outer membrane protein assembly factor BamB
LTIISEILNTKTEKYNKEKANSMKKLLIVFFALVFLSSTFNQVSLVLSSISSSDSNGDPTSWSMFHGDLTHSGYSTSSSPMTNQTLWGFATGNSVLSSPAVAGGIVYVGSNEGGISALDAFTGNRIWNNIIPSMASSSPAIANGVVYTGSQAGNMYALNALNGSIIWTYVMGGAVLSSPSVADGVVYVGSGDRNVYALNSSTGNKIWSYKTGDQVWSSPAVVDNIIYIGSEDGNVYALDATTGTKIWNYSTGRSVWSSPAVFGGFVYVGSQNGNVYALNALTGSKIWSYMTGNSVWSSPAVVEGSVYIGSYDGNVYALNSATGTKLWSQKISDQITYSSPAVAGGMVYVGSNDGNVYGGVYALNASTGTKVWSYKPSGSSTFFDSSPAIANGTVFIGCADRNVYAFRTTQTLPVTTPTPTPSVTPTLNPTNTPTKTATPPPTASITPSSIQSLTPSPETTQINPTQTPFTINGPNPTTQTTEIYIDPVYGFSIKPPTSWSQLRNLSPYTVEFKDYTELHIMSIVVVSTSQTLMGFISSLKNSFKDYYDNYAIVSENTRKIGDLTGYEIVKWQATNSGSDSYFETKELVFVDNGKAYGIMCLAPVSDYESYLPIFEQSLQTFRLPNSTIGETNSPISGFIIGLIIGIIIWIVVVAYFLWRRKTHKENLLLERAKAVETIASQTNVPSGQRVTNEPRFCLNCGAENDVDTVFCQKCGKPVAGE